MKSLRDKVCLLTGATGGIGRALAARLAERGVRLALTDQPDAPLEELAEELAGSGPQPSTHVADMRDTEAIRRLPERVEAAHGRLDLLICNAGVMSFGPFVRHSSEDLDWLLDVNLRGLIHTTHACLPLMRRSGPGHIVHMSSMNALFGVPTALMYAATKWGVRGFAMGLRAEVAPYDIGVTTVMPGMVATTLMTKGLSYDDELLAKIKPWLDRFAMDPDRLALAILQAIRKNRAELVVGPDAKLVRTIMRNLPDLLPYLLTRSYASTANRVDSQD